MLTITLHILAWLAFIVGTFLLGVYIGGIAFKSEKLDISQIIIKTSTRTPLTNICRGLCNVAQSLCSGTRCAGFRN